jgi:hypothetical protein
MNPARFRWGVLFILAGALLLLNNLDRLDWWVWADIVHLWPLLLIAIGVEKIFTRTKAEPIAYLSSLALAGVVIWVAIGGMGSADNRRDVLTSDAGSSVTALVARIDMRGHDLHLGGSTQNLYRARYGNRWSSPEVDYSLDGSTGRLAIADRNRWRWFRIDDRLTDALDVDLTQGKPVRLTCEGENADMRLDCRDLKLEELTVSSEGGKIRIMMGSASARTKVSFRGEGADFRLLLPPGCALRVQSGNEEIARFLNRLGLTASGTIFTAPGYDTLTPKIDLDLAPDVTQLAIDYF